MGPKVWKGRGCCCSRAVTVSSAVSGRRAQSKGETSSLLLRGLHHEEQASAASPAIPWSSFSPHGAVPLSDGEREIHSQGSLGWMGGLYVVVTLQQSSYIQHRAHAQQSWGEPSTFKKKACSLAVPWLFLVFVFCQLFEVLRNKFWEPCSPVISYEGVSWVILVQEMLLFDLFLLLQSTFQLPKATRRQAISWAIVARKIHTPVRGRSFRKNLDVLV